MAMNCNDFQSAVERAIELRTFVDSDVMDHTLFCEECRSFWELQKHVDDAIIAWHEHHPPKPPIDAVLTALSLDLSSPEIDADDNNFELLPSTENSHQSPRLSTQRSNRYSHQATFSATAKWTVCLLLFLATMNFLFRANQSAPMEETVLMDRAAPKDQISDSSPDLTSNLSELFKNVQNYARANAGESTTTNTNSPSEATQSLIAGIDNNLSEARIHSMSEYIDVSDNVLFNRVERGFGFLFECFSE